MTRDFCMNWFVVFNIGMVGFCVNSVLIRLEGRKDASDILFPILIIILGCLCVYIDSKRKQ